MAYLDVGGINACITFLGNQYPALASTFTLPETSRNGTVIRGYRLGANSNGQRRAVFLTGGVHARELVNPDLLLSLSVKLCQAYTTGTGLVFGGKTYTTTDVQFILNALDVYVIPLVNPDGRAYVQAPSGDPWWRKNRGTIPGSGCIGTDLNRNCDFLWQAAIGVTSTSPCNDTFHGPAAFSEPEERNVRWVLDHHPTIRTFVDVHSYSELILYPWGDDTTQTTDPTQNFTNPAWNGLRGSAGGYAEHMDGDDRTRFQRAATRVVAAIAAVRGHTYTAEPSFSLYGTSGTNEDYAYSRHLANPANNKVYGFTFETGREFQPAAAEADWVIKEGSAGLVELLLHSICAIEFIAADRLSVTHLNDLRRFRDTTMRRNALGRHLSDLLEDHAHELVSIAINHPAFADQAADLLAELTPVIAGNQPIDASHVSAAGKLLAVLHRHASPTLREATSGLAVIAEHFTGATARQGLKSADTTTKRRTTRRTTTQSSR